MYVEFNKNLKYSFQIFNSYSKKCNKPTDDQQTSETVHLNEYVKKCNLPNCTDKGRFAIPSNCSIFYICDKKDRNYLQKVFKCPGSMVYNPITKKCSYTSKMAPTAVLYIPITYMHNIHL